MQQEKQLIGRPQEYVVMEQKSPPRYDDEFKDDMLLKRMSCELVDWSGGWATPWGQITASQMRPWSEHSE